MYKIKLSLFFICTLIFSTINKAYLLEIQENMVKYGFGSDISITGDKQIIKEVNVNKPFDIQIQCNLTTGYEIFVSYFPTDIKLINSSINTPKEKGLVGAPSTCNYTFKLTNPVSTIILFTNVRPFNYDVGSTIKYEIHPAKEK
jgi:hypothetical protein